MHGLDRASLTVSLNTDWFSFDRRYLWGPEPFGIPVLRVYTHEVLHFWQVLASGFMANLALAEWRALQTFKETGQVPPAASISDTFTRRVDRLGFSPWELHEALCRFWDIHIMGPAILLGETPPEPADEPSIDPGDMPDWATDGLPAEVVQRALRVVPYTSDQFDRWMLLEDDYAQPYRLMLERLGTRGAVIYFPIAGYFALQTPRPCEVFADVVGRLADRAVSGTNASIHVLWKELFSDVANASAAACFRNTGATLTSGLPVIRALASEGNAVYAHYAALFDLAAQAWNAPDVRFALPGEPLCRLQLSALFLPPAATFFDGRWTADSVAAKMAKVMGIPGVLEREALADAALEIRADMKVLGLASLESEFASNKGQ